jgi:predicted dehydrogenase
MSGSPPAVPSPRSSVIAGEGGRRLRGAVIGCGFIAENGHLPAYAKHAESFEIVAVADANTARRAKAAALVPGATIHESAEAMLDTLANVGGHPETPGLDFVDICLPPSEHARFTHLAFDRGLHVLCEKPLATTPEEARAMLEHAVRAKRVLYPCHNYKHAPVIRSVRRVLDSGVIGKVNLVTLHTLRNTHARGVAEWRPDWRRERRYSGGGIAMDHGSHTFYLAFDWLGGYPTAITAKMTTPPGYDTEDNLACAITFPEGIATAHLTWTAGIRKVIYTIQGSAGAIRVEDDDVEVCVMKRPGAASNRGNARVEWERTTESISSDWMDAGHSEWFASLFDPFRAAIRDGDFAGREARDSLACVELISAAYASARDGSREHPAGALHVAGTLRPLAS